MTSPSSRRAWIEITAAGASGAGERSVALLAEGVDRNIGSNDDPAEVTTVALLAEGVDRNDQLQRQILDGGRRPPRGGRG